MKPKILWAKSILCASLLGSVLSGRAEFPAYELLGDFQEGSEFVHTVSDVSADGRVVVGQTMQLNTAIGVAWQWAEGAGVTLIGFPEAVSATLQKVSADGSAMGGSYTVFTNFPASSYAFRWTSTNGVQNILQTRIQAPGVNIESSGTWNLMQAGTWWWKARRDAKSLKSRCRNLIWAAIPLACSGIPVASGHGAASQHLGTG